MHTNLIAPQRLRKLQQQDSNIEILKRKLRNNRLDKEYYSRDENELLTRKVIDGGHEFRAIYLPSVLIFQVLQTAHDDLGHNGFPRTYAALKRVFFWKGMKEDIRKHCKTCATCQLHKLENMKFERKIFKPSLQPMDFICMDLIGEFQPPDKSWTPLCFDSCLYAYRVFMVRTFEDKDSGRSHESIYGPHLQ